MGNDVLAIEARLKDFVSTNIKTLENNVRQASTGMSNSLGGVSNSSKSLADVMGGKLVNAASMAVKGFIAFQTVRATISFLNDSAKAANESAIVQAKLAAALGYHSTALEEQSNALMRLSGVEDEEIANAQALLASYFKSEDAVKKLTPAILDFAKATGIDLRTAATQVARAIEDDNSEMGRWKISVEGAKGSTERMDSMLKSLNEKFGGQAAAMMEAENGSKRLSNSINELMETIGAGVNSALKPMKEGLADIIDKVTELWNVGKGKTILDDERKLYEARKKDLELQLSQAKLAANNPWSVYAVDAKKKVEELSKEIDEVNKKLGLGPKTGGGSSKPTGYKKENVPLYSIANENELKMLKEKEEYWDKYYDEQHNLSIKAREYQNEWLDGLINQTNIEIAESEKRIAQIERERQTKVNMFVSLSETTRMAMNDILALNKKHGEEGKKIAIAQATINFAMANGGAAASIWSTPGGSWQEKLAESIAISASLATQFAVQIATIKKQKYAVGTGYAPGGMSLVGENGPEVVDIPRGSRVYTHNETKNMMGGNTININVPLGVPVDMRAASSIRESAKYIGEILMQAENEGRLESVKSVLLRQ